MKKLFEKPEFEFFTGVTRLVLYLVGAAAVFFVFAVIIFVLRGRDSQKLVMPDLAGKYYIDVHNDLAQMELRVKIIKKRYNDKTPGIVLYQSISAGAPVRPREKLEVTVNQPEPFVKMPQLTSTPLATAKATLAHIPYDEDVYTLEIGAVTSVPADNVPPGTVLEQFPPGGENVSVQQRVYLLVAGDTNPLKTEKDAVGQNINVIGEWFHRTGKDYRIGEIKSPPKAALMGQIYDAKTEANGRITLGVYYRKAKARFFTGYESIKVDLDRDGECRAEQFVVGDESGQPSRVFFRTKGHEKDEEVKLMFYRTGINDVMVSCGDKVVYEKRFKPEI